ncbi:MAG: thymidylate synthase [Cyanobacteria bacterium 13_1_40CM_2_61_4]|nr:MAG: thymidylate synthase [Cyanobacteria bacterium 13_1_40CM_2_61_4]
MERLSGRSTIVAAKEQVSCSMAEEAVVLDLKAGVYYGLNEVGARVWSLVQEPRNVSDIRDAILEEFDVDPSLCERDLLVLLRDLAGRALIKVKDETAA